MVLDRRPIRIKTVSDQSKIAHDFRIVNLWNIVGTRLGRTVLISSSGTSKGTVIAGCGRLRRPWLQTPRSAANLAHH